MPLKVSLKVTDTKKQEEVFSPWQQHVSQWRGCTRCHLHKTRTHVVLARGKIPCEILFIGEAPGLSEDVLGLPMVGPAGKLFDQIISLSMTDAKVCYDGDEERPVRWAITNLLACIPIAQGGGKVKDADEFPEECVEACKPRLEQMIQVADPRLIVAVGLKARDWLEQGYTHSVKLPRKIPVVDVTHPAAILREPIAKRGLSVQKCVMTIIRAMEDHL